MNLIDMNYLGGLYCLANRFILRMFYVINITCSGGTQDLVVSVVDILSADWQNLTDCSSR
jgi:hypothetical protein